eukprot:404614-Rhodomonas_salina.2
MSVSYCGYKDNDHVASAYGRVGPQRQVYCAGHSPGNTPVDSALHPPRVKTAVQLAFLSSFVFRANLSEKLSVLVVLVVRLWLSFSPCAMHNLLNSFSARDNPQLASHSSARLAVADLQSMCASLFWQAACATPFGIMMIVWLSFFEFIATKPFDLTTEDSIRSANMHTLQRGGKNSSAHGLPETHWNTSSSTTDLFLFLPLALFSLLLRSPPSWLSCQAFDMRRYAMSETDAGSAADRTHEKPSPQLSSFPPPLSPQRVFACFVVSRRRKATQKLLHEGGRRRREAEEEGERARRRQRKEKGTGGAGGRRSRSV